MGLFSTTTHFPWIQLESEQQLIDLLEDSKEIPVLIFKHSTRCSISRVVLRSFEQEFPAEKEQLVKPVFLDLITYRNISNQIAEILKVTHQSPQAILVVSGEVVHHSSHEMISADKISSYF